jgi:transcriptional regulator with XRE-family HTH domain
MNDETPADLGAYVRYSREQAGLSQGQLAEAVGVHHSYIARIESGSRAKPAADVLQRIADVLHIESGDLLAFLGVRTNLPEPRAYFRRKYGMNARQADVLARLVEEFESKEGGDYEFDT